MQILSRSLELQVLQRSEKEPEMPFVYKYARFPEEIAIYETDARRALLAGLGPYRILVSVQIGVEPEKRSAPVITRGTREISPYKVQEEVD